MEDHVLGCGESTSALKESHAASSANEGTALRQPASNIFPLHLSDEVAALHQSLVAFIYTVGVAAHVDRHTDDGANSSVHTWGVTSRGHDGDLLFGRHCGCSRCRRWAARMMMVGIDDRS